MCESVRSKQTALAHLHCLRYTRQFDNIKIEKVNMNKKGSFGKDLEWDINHYNQSKISQEKQIKFVRNINTFFKGILSFWKNKSRL